MNTCILTILITLMLYSIIIYYRYKQRKIRYEYFRTIEYYKNNIVFMFSRYNIEAIDLIDGNENGLRLNTSIDGYESYEIYSLLPNLMAETNAGTKDLTAVITDVKDWEILEKVTYTYLEKNEKYADDLKNDVIFGYRHKMQSIISLMKNR